MALLEQVATTFYLWTAAHGFELPAPGHPLVCVWFADRDDYATFLRLEGADAFLNTSGYFHPTRRLIALRDADESSPMSFSRREESAESRMMRVEASASSDLSPAV